MPDDAPTHKDIIDRLNKNDVDHGVISTTLDNMREDISTVKSTLVGIAVALLLAGAVAVIGVVLGGPLN